uniref:piggyBac transposable element-derived protein 4-like n=1 Tax=Monopterus albus TaxID=43700 RepID=UPI0009B49EC3|nr:piggyBac transposable element-derived protein 4-like [Monopterus albus]
MRVVMQMTKGLRGHVVTCDNFFISFPLSQELLKNKVALVGTIRRNKLELPPHVLQAKGRAMYSSTFAFTSTHTLVSYIPRRGRNVLLLSTKHRGPDVGEGQKKKPATIEDYKRCKGGVDNLDKVVCSPAGVCANRWPLALFHNLLDVSLYNVFVLWTSLDPSWQEHKTYKRRLFIQEVGEQLVTPHIQRRERLPRASNAANLVMEMQDGAAAAAAGPSQRSTVKCRRQCHLCSRKRVGGTYYKCHKFICKNHSLSICSL